MASLFDSPSLVASRDAARRDTRLLQRAYRDARKKDPREALKIAQQADAMGLPVGRPSNDAEIAGVGEANYARRLRDSGQPDSGRGGLDGYSFAQQGVGYDFTHSKDRQNPMSMTDQYRQLYRGVGNDEQQQNAVIAQANAQGVPLSDYGRQRLLRASILKPQALPPSVGNTQTQTPAPITSPGNPTLNQGAQAGSLLGRAVGANFPSLLQKRQTVIPGGTAPPAAVAPTALPTTTQPQTGMFTPGRYDRYQNLDVDLSRMELMNGINERMRPYREASRQADLKNWEGTERYNKYYADRGITPEQSLNSDYIEGKYRHQMELASQRRRKLRDMAGDEDRRMRNDEREANTGPWYGSDSMHRFMNVRKRDLDARESDRLLEIGGVPEEFRAKARDQILNRDDGMEPDYRKTMERMRQLRQRLR